MIGLRAKLRLCQHQAKGRASCRYGQKSRPGAHVGHRSFLRSLHQHNLLLHIHYNHPLQSMAMICIALRGVVVPTSQKTIQRGVVRRGLQFQGSTQFWVIP